MNQVVQAICFALASIAIATLVEFNLLPRLFSCVVIATNFAAVYLLVVVSFGAIGIEINMFFALVFIVLMTAIVANHKRKAE